MMPRHQQKPTKITLRPECPILPSEFRKEHFDLYERIRLSIEKANKPDTPLDDRKQCLRTAESVLSRLAAFASEEGLPPELITDSFEFETQFADYAELKK